VSEWRRSEQTASEFSAAHGVGRASLYGWAAELKRRSEQGDEEGFVAVEVVGPRRPMSRLAEASSMELVALSGRVIRVSGHIDAEALAAVLGVAERC